MPKPESQYTGNSHRQKEAQEERKKVEKVTTGAVKTKKKSEVKKMADVFVAEDVRSVKDYIIMDVLLPAAKKAISDMVTTGIDMILYGEKGAPKSKGHKTSYTKYYDDRDRRERREYSRARVGYDFDDIVLESRGEAEEVLDRLYDLMDTYGIVSVADLYDLVGINGRYTDNKYGWTSLRNARVERCRDGYILSMPKALPID